MKTADVLVVGGGPAGSMTAWLLARAGCQVVLCEAHAVLPARVCGMYLCPAGVALLDRVGMRARVEAGARSLQGMIMVSPSLHRLETRFPRDVEAPDHGLALPRPALDNALLEAAREAGVVVRMGVRPALERVAGRWVATAPEFEPVAARVLVGADGRKSSTARMLGLSLPVRRSRAAIHIDRPSRQATSPFGQMHVFADGTYIGVNPIHADTVNISLVCDPAELRATSVVEAINRRLAISPYLASLIEPLPDGVRPGATFPAGARVRRAATEDAALVGDASGYIDPLTGEGIYAALWTADELATGLMVGWSDVPAALAGYARMRARRQRAKSLLCELFQTCIRRPWLADSILQLLSRQQAVADSFIGIVGNSYPPGRGLMRIAGHALASF